MLQPRAQVFYSDITELRQQLILRLVSKPARKLKYSRYRFGVTRKVIKSVQPLLHCVDRLLSKIQFPFRTTKQTGDLERRVAHVFMSTRRSIYAVSRADDLRKGHRPRGK
jgi:hypothetical protein